MPYIVKSTSVDRMSTDCVMLPVYAEKPLSPTVKKVDSLYGGQIKQLIKSHDFKGQVGETLVLRQPDIKKCPRVLLVGMGTENSLSRQTFIKIAMHAMQALINVPIKQITCALVDIKVNEADALWNIQQLIIANEKARYQFNEMKSERKSTPKAVTIAFQTDNKSLTPTQIKRTIDIATSTIEGMTLCKNLANLPANVCTPTYLAKEAQAIAKRFRPVKVKILEERDMQRLGMNSLLSVARGSHQPAKLITLEYRGSNKNKKPLVFVGKGITFDSGGISLKQGLGMDEMKFDMCGAATVLALIHIAATLKLPLNIVGVIAATENLPGGNASKPGDIVKSMSGQTIEILNTDAEGRLVLCDALTYCKRFKPELVIDIATLTGAIIVSLGTHATGLMTQDDQLASALIKAGEQMNDRVWRLPIWDEYQDVLESNFADIANIGDGKAGSIIGACFLARFAKDFRWAHLDIAGTAYQSGKAKGASGRPVALLTQFMLNQLK